MKGLVCICCKDSHIKFYMQRALKVTLDIPKTARYHIIFRAITNESSPVTGKVMLTPKGGVGSKQSSPVTFGSTNVPTHHTVGDKGMATQFMLTKGQWDLMLVLPPASVLLVRILSFLYSATNKD